MNTRKNLFILMTALVMILTGIASAQSENDPAAQIEAKVTNTNYKYNDKTGSVIFQIDTELTNNSNAGIMEIKYRLHFLDKNGEEMETATGVFNGQDTPLAPGKSTSHYRGGQFAAENKPNDICVEVLSALTEEEMPPIYLPKAGDHVYRVLNNKNLENIKEEPPIAVRLWIDHGGARDEALLETPEEIASFVDAFTKVRILEESDIWVTDNYNGVSMEFSNGEYLWISLNLNNLEYEVYGSWHVYELTDDEDFWQQMYGLTKPVNHSNEYTLGGS